MSSQLKSHSQPQIDLPRYCARIGYVGDLKPNFEVLSGLMNRHICSVPFENLDELIGKPVLVDPESVEQKIVENRRGGYCFEQNGLFLAVLQAIGFDATPLAGRIRLGAEPGETTSRTHLLLRVLLNDIRYLVDVGVGGFSLRAPLQMDVVHPQSQGSEIRRIKHSEGRFTHQIESKGEWMDIYEWLDCDIMPLADRKVANWYTSTHPDSHFRSEFFCALANEDGSRHGLNHHKFTHRHGDETLETREIESQEELRDILITKFNLPQDIELPPFSSS